MTSKAKITITKDIVDSVLRSVRAAAGERVLIGIPAEGAMREPDPDDPNPSITNAQIGYINEFGDPGMNIPARPHLVPGVRLSLDGAVNIYKSGLKAELNGHKGAIHNSSTKVGLYAVGKVQGYLTNAVFTPLSPVTIAARRRKGRTGDKPLLDTGQYRRAMTFVIKAGSNA